MAIETSSSVFLVDAYSDPICLKIKGRANYLNCGPLNDFFNKITQKNNTTIIVDFEECTGMDSTFLGLLAGVALEFKKQEKKGAISLFNVNNRNLELIENLGLNRILKVNPDEYKFTAVNNNITNKLQSLGTEDRTTPEAILKAHQNLISTKPSNLYKFQDVVSFLKKQVDQDT